MKTSVNIVWFKRDLRIEDHFPLSKASDENIPFIPLYILEDEYWKQSFSSYRHWSFIWDCLVDLDGELHKLGQPLIIKRGNSKKIFQLILKQFQIKKIYAHEETANKWVKNRNDKIRNWCFENSIELIEYPTNGIVRNLKSRDEWSKIKTARLYSETFKAPQSIQKIYGLKSDNVYKETLNFENISGMKVQTGGRKNGLKALEKFLNDNGKFYLKNISSPQHSDLFCSRISPHLTWGSLSSKEILKKINLRKKNLPVKDQASWKKNLNAFQSRLSWRCHFIQKLEDDPSIEYSCMHKLLENLRSEPSDDKLFEAWKKGMTGYPFVDACMRSLIHEGWITFRMRAMLVSFASYDLWLDWRKFGCYLAQLFTDYEPGIHYSQLQMQSGVTGINTLRIYNPIKQSKEHDQDGKFIKKWVPELKDLNSQWIHEPWKMSKEIQKEFNCLIGKDYPMPIVDHSYAIKLAKGKISNIKKEYNYRNISKNVYLRHGSRNTKRDQSFVDKQIKLKKHSKQLSFF